MRRVASGLACLFALACAKTTASAPSSATPPAVAPVEAPGASSPSADEEAARYEKAAIAAYREHDYESALTNFERAYAANGDPKYLYNLARVHEETAQLEAAVRRYEEYATQSGASLDDREIALERARILKQVIATTQP